MPFRCSPGERLLYAGIMTFGGVPSRRCVRGCQKVSTRFRTMPPTLAVLFFAVPAAGHLENAKIYQRELIRLEMSLQHGMKLGERKKRVALLHFPPFDAQGGETQVTRILEKYQVSFAVYGHIHGMGIKSARNGELNGIGYQLVSCDALDFTLFKLPVTGE